MGLEHPPKELDPSQTTRVLCLMKLWISINTWILMRFTDDILCIRLSFRHWWVVASSAFKLPVSDTKENSTTIQQVCVSVCECVIRLPSFGLLQLLLSNQIDRLSDWPSYRRIIDLSPVLSISPASTSSFLRYLLCAVFYCSGGDVDGDSTCSMP